MTYDGKPWFPVMGEMHYSRYREDLWEESLRKMKAAGVQNIRCKLYPGARHELLVETNRQEVFADIAAWLNDQLR